VLDNFSSRGQMPRAKKQKEKRVWGFGDLVSAERLEF